MIQTRSQILEMQERIAQSIGAKDAGIFDAHLLVVEDRTLIDEVLRKLQADLCNVEFVFQEVATHYAKTLSEIDDPYLRERALDIQDVTRRVVRNLLGKAPKDFLSLTQPHILIAHNLTPSDTATMNREYTLGLATDLGSRTSHTAIMARSLESRRSSACTTPPTSSRPASTSCSMATTACSSSIQRPDALGIRRAGEQEGRRWPSN